jgi:hypothetical protein
MFGGHRKKRDFKFDEKQEAKRGFQLNQAGKKEDDGLSGVGVGVPRARGRKPIYIK